MRERVLLGARVQVEPAVVVAAHQDLVLVRQRGEPVDLLLDGGRRAAVGQVAAVDQQVTVGHVLDGGVVRVRQTHDLDRHLVPRRPHRVPAQPEDDGVEEVDEALHGRREEPL